MVQLELVKHAWVLKSATEKCVQTLQPKPLEQLGWLLELAMDALASSFKYITMHVADP